MSFCNAPHPFQGLTTHMRAERVADEVNVLGSEAGVPAKPGDQVCYL